MADDPMERRDFIQKSAVAASVAAIGARAYAAQASKARRVGLIGCGWYGKCDLLQLVNIEPVEIVSLCDVDSKMLADCLTNRNLEREQKTWAVRRMAGDEARDGVGRPIRDRPGKRR